MQKNAMTNEQIAMRVSIHSIIGNIALSAFKLFAGIFARSSAMVSDSVHSMSDILSTFIVMIGVKIANKESDHNHQYGHERFESVAALVLAFLLAATGFAIGYNGVNKIIKGNYETIDIPGTLALIAAIISIIVKEAMYWYTKKAAKKISSSALMADAWHHRSDAFSSLGSFAGIFGARMGVRILDPIASVVICIFIVKAAWDIFFSAIRKMTDEACPKEVVDEIETLLLKQEGIIRIDRLHTRLFGDKYYVDVEICVDGTLSLHEAHRIAENAHDVLEQAFSQMKHCMVHVNPCGSGGASEEAVK